MENEKTVSLDLVLSFLGNLTLCDHMGDVAGDVKAFCDKAGIELGEWWDREELGRILHRRGVKTLYDTDVSSEEEEDGEGREVLSRP